MLVQTNECLDSFYNIIIIGKLLPISYYNLRVVWSLTLSFFLITDKIFSWNLTVKLNKWTTRYHCLEKNQLLPNHGNFETLDCRQ